jgi:TRAP-type C4-dicarboxylate transport system permease small subunit
MSSQKYPFISKLSRILHCGGIYICLPVLVVILTIDVFMRYVFNSPLLWGSEVSALILSLVFFASLPHITDSQSHIRMDMFYRLMNARMKAVTDVLTGLCGAIFAILLTYQSLKSSVEMYRWGEGAEMIDIPYWPFVLFAGICGLMLTIHFIAQVITALCSTGRESND